MEMTMQPTDADSSFGRVNQRQPHPPDQQTTRYSASTEASHNDTRSICSHNSSSSSSSYSRSRLNRTCPQSCCRWCNARRAVLFLDGLACAHLAFALAIMLILLYAQKAGLLDADSGNVAHEEILWIPTLGQLRDTSASFAMALAGVLGAIQYNAVLLAVAILLPCWNVLRMIRQDPHFEYDWAGINAFVAFLHVKLILEARARPKPKSADAHEMNLTKLMEAGIYFLESTEAYLDLEPGRIRRDGLVSTGASSTRATTHGAFRNQHSRSSCCECCSVRCSLLFLNVAAVAFNTVGILLFVAFKSNPGLWTDEQKSESSAAVVLAAGGVGAVEAGILILLAIVGVVGALRYDARLVVVATLRPCWQIMEYLFFKFTGTGTLIDCCVHGMELCLVALFIREIRTAKAKAQKAS